jgi:phosphoglycolate phosphatase
LTFPLIVFDLDGTLVDSRRDLADSVNLTLASCGATPLPLEQVTRIIGEGAPILIAKAFAAVGQEPPPDALDRFLRFYNQRLTAHTRAYDGIPELLGVLQPRATLGVLTNKPIHGTREILSGLGLARFFEPHRVFGGDGPLARKPQPDGLLRLAEEAGAPIAETLMVGDSLIDFETARNAGARVCLARYGFGFEMFPRERLDVCDLAIDAPGALLSAVTF